MVNCSFEREWKKWLKENKEDEELNSYDTEEIRKIAKHFYYLGRGTKQLENIEDLENMIGFFKKTISEGDTNE